MPSSSRTGSRRRGTALTAAIYRAVLGELARTSFEELSFDKVATAAATGKAALYRRWSTPAELVMAALTDPVSGFGTPPGHPRTGSLRGDLVKLLRGLAAALDEPRGRALLPLITQRHRHPHLLEEVRRSVLDPAKDLIGEVLADAVERGEADPARITERAVTTGPRLVVLETWEQGRAEVEAIVDQVLLPLFSPSAPAGRGGRN
jgi:AcrR family transcriptional regulator